MVALTVGALSFATAARGDYEGVNPESETAENLPPKVEEIPEGALMLTWPGFMMQEDGSSFFVQTSKEVRFGTRRAQDRFGQRRRLPTGQSQLFKGREGEDFFERLLRRLFDIRSRPVHLADGRVPH